MHMWYGMSMRQLWLRRNSCMHSEQCYLIFFLKVRNCIQKSHLNSFLAVLENCTDISFDIGCTFATNSAFKRENISSFAAVIFLNNKAIIF